MKKIALLLALLPLTFATFAKNIAADSAKKIDEVFIAASSKEQASLEKLPIAYTSLSAKQIERNSIASPNDLSAIVPNFYMPDYGSKLTSAIYIRGIGSRMNESAVGLYVDNAPYLDKSSFDFDYFDLAGIEVLRGPQGALYGRNAMGGIINIYTVSPLSKQGTKVYASYGNANSVNAIASHAHKFGENVGISVGGSYNQTDGFFTNDYDGSKSDAIKSGAARLRLDWKITDRLRLNYTLSGEYGEQSGYAYGMVDSTGKVHNPNYNAPMGYKRALVNNGLFLQYNGEGYTLSSSTSYQYFNDRMQLDQDFTPANMFTIEQKQKQNAVTEEIVIKSQSDKNYQWLFGAFGFYKGLNTDAPVNFMAEGVPMIQAAMDAALDKERRKNPRTPYITIVDTIGSNNPASNLFIPSEFQSTSFGAAAYHQSTYNNLFLKGLSITGGLRVDYEKINLKYQSSALMYSKIVITGMPRPIWATSNPTYDDKLSSAFFELLPKIALQYEFGQNKYKVYATATKGYTTGGYNLQIFSDIVRDNLQNNTTFSADTIKNSLYYKPEYSWNYEVGGSASLFDRKLNIAASAFFIDTRDQQIVQFVPSGYGRIMKNAGHSQSYGAEISLSGHAGNLTGHVAYGYTHATFKQYTDSVKPSTGAAYEVDYKGNYVPFAPQHTLSVGAEYDFYFNSKVLDKLTIGATYTGAGKIYFTAANEDMASQKFYSLLNAKVSVEKSIFHLGFWARNLLDTEYKTFYFESMGNSFAQQGKPVQFGVEVSVKF